MDNSLKAGSSFFTKCSDCFAACLVSSSSANALLQLHEKDRNIMFEAGGKWGRDAQSSVCGTEKDAAFRACVSATCMYEMTESDSQSRLMFTCWARSQLTCSNMIM